MPNQLITFHKEVSAGAMTGANKVFYLFYNDGFVESYVTDVAGQPNVVTAKDKNIITEFTALTYATTINWSIFTSGLSVGVTLTGNATLQINNGMAGQCGTLRVTQDATGNRALAFPANSKFQGGVPIQLSTAPNAVDILTFFYDGANYYWNIGKDYK